MSFPFDPSITIYSLNGGYVVVSLEDEETQATFHGVDGEGDVITQEITMSEVNDVSHVFTDRKQLLRFLVRYFRELGQPDISDIEREMRNKDG